MHYIQQQWQYVNKPAPPKGALLLSCTGDNKKEAPHGKHRQVREYSARTAASHGARNLPQNMPICTANVALSMHGPIPWRHEQKGAILYPTAPVTPELADQHPKHPLRRREDDLTERRRQSQMESFAPIAIERKA